MSAKFVVTARVLPDGAAFNVPGRVGWALAELVRAGQQGCTPLRHPAPRWSSYIHRLRRDHGLVIETVTESHPGLFAGHHARYILRSPVALEEVTIAA